MFATGTRRGESGDFATRAHRMHAHVRSLNPSRLQSICCRTRVSTCGSAAPRTARQAPRRDVDDCGAGSQPNVSARRVVRVSKDAPEDS